MIDRWVMLISLLNCCSRALRHATLTPKCVGVPYTCAKVMKPKPARFELGMLEELAAKVVRGAAEKVVPIGSQLKRKKSWNLFLGEANREFSGVAILVVNKKSTFTLDDAHTALGIIEDEGSARSLQGPDTTTRQLLLATRANIVPAADAFLRNVRIGQSSDGIMTVTMRWEQLEGLVHDGHLRRYLDAVSSSTSPGADPILFQPPSFSLPSWLREDREQKTKAKFDLQAPFEPSGDQPQAIEALVRGVEAGKRHQTLLGATGTGKTFIVANVIKKTSLPTLVLAPNKVLAAQLTNELRALFPNNAVEYFVSYYDYYMPEAFVSSSDTYIDKVVQINDDIDRMRHSATRSLLERRDVIVVASVSCIYGLGMPNKYLEASIRVTVGQSWDGGWKTLAQHLDQNMSYSRQLNEEEFRANHRGSFRAVSCQDGGGVVEVGPAAEEVVIRIGIDAAGLVQKIQILSSSQDNAVTSAMFEEVALDLSERVAARAVRGMDMMDMNDIGHDGKTLPKGQGANDVEAYVIYPAKHHVIGEGDMVEVLAAIGAEMEERCFQLGREGRMLEAERLRQRTENDLLLIRAVGTCKGIENYSRHLAGRGPGEPPETLVDYFPQDDWLLVVDESHVSAPQLGAMFGGDRARKAKLVEHGFRLPSALDNRPLKAGEFWSKVKKSIFVSATPGKFEIELSNPGNLRRISVAQSKYRREIASNNTTRRGRGLGWDVIEDLVDAQAVIRPTGITDPPVEIRPSESQVSDLVRECKAKRELGERVLVTTLTKRMAEDLSAFLVEQGVPTAYLHSEVKPMQRLELLRQLRKGEVDVIVGVNLLREGLNLPEVSLVCILDADAEGFLRSDTALLQIIGRATRHVAGRAVLYANRMTPSMQRALTETDRRRDIQTKHNALNDITPRMALAASDSLLDSTMGDDMGLVNVGGIEPLTRHRQGARDDTGGHNSDTRIVSWAESSLQPHQVQLLYDMSARSCRGESRGRSSFPHRLPRKISTSDRGRDCTKAGSCIHAGTVYDQCRDDTRCSLLAATDDTYRALKRLAERAAAKMARAASKTDFKEAALWRDRRDEVLASTRDVELEAYTIACDVTSVSIEDGKHEDGSAS